MEVSSNQANGSEEMLPVSQLGNCEGLSHKSARVEDMVTDAEDEGNGTKGEEEDSMDLSWFTSEL